MLYQQGTQRIEIIVRKDGGGSTQTAAKETPTDEIGERETTWRTSVFGSENPNRIKRVIKTNTTHALAVTKQVVDLGIEYWVSGLGYKTGDQSYQENVQRRFEIVKDVGGFVGGVLKDGKKVIAMIAPAIAGQFPGNIYQLKKVPEGTFL